jgi:hypothetical protein
MINARPAPPESKSALHEFMDEFMVQTNSMVKSYYEFMVFDSSTRFHPPGSLLSDY